MRTKRLNKKEGYIEILSERSDMNETDKKFLRTLPTDQLRLMVTREDELEMIDDPLELVEV